MLDLCLKCGNEDETATHLFVNCFYNKALWATFSMIGNILQKSRGRFSEDDRIVDLIEGIEKFQKKAACWGFYLMALAAFT